MAPRPRVTSDDATIRIPPTRRPGRRRGVVILLAALGIGAVGASVAFWLDVPPAAPPAAVQQNAPPPPRAPVAVGGEARILAARAQSLEVFRFDAMPRVLVLSFPSLHAQGVTLDRLGAFVEKAGLPRDRPLPDAELAAAIQASGDTADTYYYGHDYGAGDLRRFFAAAPEAGVVLRPEELRLRALLDQEGLLAPGAVGAFVSIPPESADPPIDAVARATILRHELSHGLFFTDPAYAAHARDFWAHTLTAKQRDGWRRFLAGRGYDTANEDLLLNETQAFLMHTADVRFFAPADAGLTEAEAKRLRLLFRNGMPDGWLKEVTPAP